VVTSITDAGSVGSRVVSDLNQSGKATTHSVLFAFNSAELDREAKPVLDSVAQYLTSNSLLSG
jgi:outer membrane protein OmpA-like peptidoglycan-associated protein